MITNATLQRIDTPGPASTSGDVSYTQGPALAVPCFLDGSERAMRFLQGDVAREASAMLYVRKADLDGAAIAEGNLVSIELEDDDAARTYQVLSITGNTKGALSHFEAALKGL